MLFIFVDDFLYSRGWGYFFLCIRVLVIFRVLGIVLGSTCVITLNFLVVLCIRYCFNLRFIDEGIEVWRGLGSV